MSHSLAQRDVSRGGAAVVVSVQLGGLLPPDHLDRDETAHLVPREVGGFMPVLDARFLELFLRTLVDKAF